MNVEGHNDALIGSLIVQQVDQQVDHSHTVCCLGFTFNLLHVSQVFFFLFVPVLFGEPATACCKAESSCANSSSIFSFQSSTPDSEISWWRLFNHAVCTVAYYLFICLEITHTVCFFMSDATVLADENIKRSFSFLISSTIQSEQIDSFILYYYYLLLLYIYIYI